MIDFMQTHTSSKIFQWHQCQRAWGPYLVWPQVSGGFTVFTFSLHSDHVGVEKLVGKGCGRQGGGGMCLGGLADVEHLIHIVHFFCICSSHPQNLTVNSWPVHGWKESESSKMGQAINKGEIFENKIKVHFFVSVGNSSLQSFCRSSLCKAQGFGWCTVKARYRLQGSHVMRYVFFHACFKGHTSLSFWGK